MSPELVISSAAMFCAAGSIAYTMYCNNIRSEEWHHMFEWMKIQETINKEYRKELERLKRLTPGSRD
jgi:hypothetical protein